MAQASLPVVFMRGGTSKGLFFHARDLPEDAATRERFLLAAFGSPDPYGRQLNGMGGGISSLSKAILVRPSTHAEADIDYHHGQVAVDRAVVDWSANCGNLSAAVGPFALDERLIAPSGAAETTVRLHNINTGALIHARIPVSDGAYSPEGSFAMPGVAGTGARIALEYLSPGEPGTGALFPTGRTADQVVLDGVPVAVTLAYAALPVVWVHARDIGVDPTALPDAIDADARAMGRLDRIRREAAVLMGLAATPEAANLATPKVGLVAPPRAYRALDGSTVRAGDIDFLARMISMGRAHKAIPLTGAMCLAAACLAPGTVPHEVCAGGGPDVRIGTPSGALTVGAVLAAGRDAPVADRTIVYATARRLMEGRVFGAV